ncbi:hypothetical protein [Actinopolyspora mortivallis]|nr:hypothetical protein [Actinopolyspora mortivallis]
MNTKSISRTVGEQPTVTARAVVGGQRGALPRPHRQAHEENR